MKKPWPVKRAQHVAHIARKVLIAAKKNAIIKLNAEVMTIHIDFDKSKFSIFRY